MKERLLLPIKIGRKVKKLRNKSGIRIVNHVREF